MDKSYKTEIRGLKRASSMLPRDFPTMWRLWLRGGDIAIHPSHVYMDKQVLGERRYCASHVPHGTVGIPDALNCPRPCHLKRIIEPGADGSLHVQLHLHSNTC